MTNIRLLLEYDGTAYRGWQRQAHDPTVQGAVEDALKRLTQAATDVAGAGRTDAGVHARGQVASFTTTTRLTAPEVKRGMNALLPADIVVHEASEAAPDFHARFSATEREYSYTISRAPAAIMRNFVWVVTYDLHLDPMRWAAASILGEHDFTSFCKSAAEVENRRCRVHTANWEADGPLLRFTVRADRFLHGMVRALVGTMVEVGRGHREVGDIERLLEQSARSHAGEAAPARGLVLERVFYGNSPSGRV